ncbi:MAG: phosphoadenosine phosphosulfate reductase family protein [Leptospiraceae bacterium]|nr:phosphoadenosine phosphosulfate reductase family protein [Leptospiraceae bacterium]MCP5513499.1 phosphoadenosine phosphosulfate reductase family protein [Leptospiraceae bacterium]
MSSNPRHILSISGGKDSTALAIFMKQNYPEIEMEYVFCDTGEELPETYEYLEKIETYLGKKVTHLRSDLSWDEWLEKFSGYLPSARSRWCTSNLKIIPFEKFVGDSEVISYIGIRADENREGYISTKTNITARYPFKEHGINKEDVMQILHDSGLGVPAYYEWRTRSGCYFCFFQRKYEWLGLKERHPELFEKAKKYETINADGSAQNFTWVQNTTLDEIVKYPEKIRKNHKKFETRVKEKKKKSSTRLLDVFSDELDFEDALSMEDDSEGCLVCHI